MHDTVSPRFPAHEVKREPAMPRGRAERGEQ